MTAAVFLPAFAALSCLELSLVFFLVYRAVSRRPENLLFSLLTLSLAGMIGATLQLQEAPDYRSGLLWYRLQLVSISCAVATLLHFTWLLTGHPPLRRGRLGGLYLGAALLASAACHREVLHLPDRPVPLVDLDEALVGPLYPVYMLILFSGALWACGLVWRALRSHAAQEPAAASDARPYLPLRGQFLGILGSLGLFLLTGFLEFVQSLGIPSSGLPWPVNPRAIAALIFCGVTAWALAVTVAETERRRKQFQTLAQMRLAATSHMQHQVKNALA